VPSTAFTGAQEFVDLYSASCGFDGWCTAVGSFSDTNNKNEPLVEVVSPSGAVTAQQAPQPSDQASGNFIDAQLQDVSCLSSTDCTAVGWYVTNANSGDPVGLIDTLSGGTWSARPAATPNNAAMGAAAFSVLYAVACSGRGACQAGGFFNDSSSNELGLLNSYTPAEGYWLDAADGGVFAFPSATFLGSMGGMHLNAPVVGMATTPGNGGYWLVASDGGIFSFGNAQFYGSTGSLHLNAPIVGMAATPSGGGYWEVAADGGVFNFDASFYGSRGGQGGNDRFFGMVSTPDGGGYLLTGQHPASP
jgi:hypothetical protein